ncbi:metal ABC transporter permease [Rarobacter faecitabidus]|uniref:ABC-type Mn2+/Zn2+ transport system permease subunit n=1 Tax=Rarobacter faecitabidus TaxID=13243 RepID=A0A542ZE35_RARFA|nr:metal ABC transporter permease [Rarobacter faecitabidus]TQL58588.1 ABC-type Mn2+/Zn2+ transport system permease subunit [Rarobacter faecitabidus]
MSDFYQSAQLQALLLGAAAGIVGTIVLLRRRSFFTVALTHASFPGAVIASLLGLNVVLGAGLFSLVLVGVLTLISRVRRQGAQVATGVVLTGGFALGMLLQSMFPSRTGDVGTYLIGSILTVSRTDLIATSIVLAAAVLVVAVWGNNLLFSSFDPIGYRAAGFSAIAIDVVALGLIAAMVAVTMPAAGSILSIAIIVAPAATARLITGRIHLLMPLASAIAVASLLAGLEASRAWNVAAGGAMSLAAAAVFAVVLVIRTITDRVRMRHG